MLFETPNPSLNKRVSYIDLDDTLGYKAISQLQFLKKDRKKYKQLFIQMEGSNDDHKLELLGVGKDYNLLPRRRRPVDKRNIKKITN
ncbi:MAG: hypothetical protein ABJA70_06485 [Chryseolinea sp.]